MSFRARLRKLDLRAKVSLALLAVLVPVFSLLGLSAHLLIRSALLRELEQIGISSGKTLASEIVAQRLLRHSDPGSVIESRVREFLYLQPNIRRIEVYAPDAQTQVQKIIASSIEEDPAEVLGEPPPGTDITTQLFEKEVAAERRWVVWVPIRTSTAAGKMATKPLGHVRVEVSINSVSRLAGAVTKATLIGGFFGVIVLFFLLNGVLRRTIENDRKLKEAEKENLALSEQLHEAERNLLNLEKFAVLGQLTATFAHEIGTPLNAIGGHLALLKDEVRPESSMARFGIIESQLAKIADIVRGFLQSTSKPASQRQLIDPHQIIERTLSIVRPRIESLGVRINRDFDRSLGPIRVVPVDLEQVLLNLVNNSLDSLRSKSANDRKGAEELEIHLKTRKKKVSGNEVLAVEIRDSGEGIPKSDLSRVLQPFFTTKGPGEGTGLGLAICRDLVRKYEGDLKIDSEHGEWTEVEVDLPYRADASSERSVG